MGSWKTWSCSHFTICTKLVKLVGQKKHDQVCSTKSKTQHKGYFYSSTFQDILAWVFFTIWCRYCHILSQSILEIWKHVPGKNKVSVLKVGNQNSSANMKFLIINYNLIGKWLLCWCLPLKCFWIYILPWKLLFFLLTKKNRPRERLTCCRM